MRIPLTEVVTDLASDLFGTFQARRTALNGSNDLYHFQMAINEYGEKKVVDETAAVLQARDESTYAEAAAKAAQRVQTALELTAGIGTFKEVRDNLNAKNAKDSSAAPLATAT